ncbi:transmembrane protein 265 [Pelodytes ibericus]
MTDAQELKIMSSSGILTNGSGAGETSVFIPGSDVQGDTQSPAHSGPKPFATSQRCRHAVSCSLRRLAVMSIVCGFSCVGIKALLLAMKAEKETNLTRFTELAQRSQKMSVLSMSLWLGTLLCLPLLLILLSYILAVAE